MLYEPIILGKTGLKVSRLGIGASYGAPASSIEMAFERGINFFYWGSLRTREMQKAILNLGPNNRDKLVIALQSYSRIPALIPFTLKRGLKQLKTDYADILILGWYNKMPSPKILDTVFELKNKGLIRYIGISSHNRPQFQKYIKDGFFDIIMVRYNAAHRGAEKDVFPYLPEEGGPGVITYTATRWGDLLNKKKIPNNEKVPLSSDCYRFNLSHPKVHLCFTGPKDELQMKEALKTLELGLLSPEELDWMRRVGDHVYKTFPRLSISIPNPFAKKES